MVYNEVEFYGQKLISAANDTVTAEALKRGYTAHDAAGNPISGTLDQITAAPLAVTENGTYTAPAGNAYTPVTVAIPVYDGTVIDLETWLTFQSQSEFTLATRNGAKTWDGTLEWSADKNTWTVWNGTTSLNSRGGKLYLRGTGNSVITRDNSAAGFAITGSGVSCTGNIETLLDYQTVLAEEHPAMGNYCYGYLFYNCAALTEAPELPATTIPVGCYYYMFYGCTALRLPPALPTSITASTKCYMYMFYGCTALTRIPSLPAVRLGTWCYNSMFRNCTSLKFSATQDEEYRYEFRIPASGSLLYHDDSTVINMISGTGGTFTSMPQYETTYYTTTPLVTA